jgi:hypothetical protein
MVAEKLGMTVAELRERMSPVELAGWAAFYELRAKHEKEAMEKAKGRRR